MKLYCPECKSVFEDEELELCPKDSSRLFTLEADIEDPLLGATIDSRFKIEKLLGRGGMGAVYLGVQLSVGRNVAVKVLRNELIDREVALERFYRESKIISGLSHPNIVRLIEFGQDRERDLLYLVMELVDGFNLGDILETGRMRVALALEIVYQVCGALTEPHALDVIHRDLKPDNLLIVPISDGTIQVKVLDFGIARALETNTQLTATGMVCGTPQYMAPEQAQNSELGPGTDLYALGVMLYEMLCGQPPFTGQNSLQVMLQQIQTTPPPLRNYLPPSALPDEVEDLVKDMLAKGVEGRPQSAREVRDRIDKIRRLYDLDPVRIDPDLPRENMFDEWVLEALPTVGGKLSQTEALRRETGMQPRHKHSTHTTDERRQLETADTGVMGGAMTSPVSDAARVRIQADAHGRRDMAASGGASGGFGEPTSPPAGNRQSTESTPGVPQAEAQAERPTASTNTYAAADEGKNSGLFAVLGVVLVGILLAGGVAVGLVLNNLSKPDGETSDPDAIATSETNDTANETTPVTTPPVVAEEKKPEEVKETTPKETTPAAQTTAEGEKAPEKDKPEEVKKAPEKKKVVKKTPEKKEPEKKTPEKEEKTAKTETTPEKTPEKTVSVDTVKKTPTIEKKPEIKKNTGLGNLFGDSKPKKKDDKKKLETYFNK